MSERQPRSPKDGQICLWKSLDYSAVPQKHMNITRGFSKVVIPVSLSLHVFVLSNLE